MSIDLTKMDKSEVLAALYNGSHLQGMGVFQARAGAMSKDDAAKLLDEDTYFDYLYGKVMKLDFSKDFLRTRLYNRDVGEGAAERILSKLKGYAEAERNE